MLISLLETKESRKWDVVSPTVIQDSFPRRPGKPGRIWYLEHSEFESCLWDCHAVVCKVSPFSDSDNHQIRTGLWQTDLISIGGPRYLNKLSTWEWLSNIGVEFTSRSLGWAASHGCLNIIQFLLANGVELTEEVRREALDDAAISGSVETFKFLEGDGSVPKEEFTLLAVSSGSLELVKYLESSHLKYYVPQAISSGNLEMLKYLIEVGGAEPSLENLEHATRQGSLDLVRYLVEEGGINPDDYHELLLRVARGGKVEVLQYLLSRSKFPHIERIEEHLSQQRKVLESLKLIEKAMGLV